MTDPEIIPRDCLQGIRIWLSGSVPEQDSWGERALDLEILEFVHTFSSLVLKYGGQIVHGSHPSFTPILLAEAGRHAAPAPPNDHLTLAISDLWAGKMDKSELDRWRRMASLKVVPAAGEGDAARDTSLAMLRTWMARNSDIFVAVGGKWWSNVPGRAGVPVEFELARAQGMPCFVLGGFGGPSLRYLNEDPEILGQMENGLSIEENLRLATVSDVGRSAGLIFAQIAKLRVEASSKFPLTTGSRERRRTMNGNSRLTGIRVMLSGSIPDDSPNAAAIEQFVQTFAARVLREGGTIVHGSHPSFIEPLKRAAVPFVQADGTRDALVLARALKYSTSPEQLKEIETLREFASVEVLPSLPGEATKSLVPMREWLASRSDVVVAVGGRWYEVSKERAGVPRELEESLRLGNPGFVLAGFGGAIASYLDDDRNLVARLHNGLSVDDNLQLAAMRDPVELTDRILTQIKLLPLLRGNTSSGRRFRILALDGGGLRGAFTAAVLAKWAEMLGPTGGPDLVKHFDLVAGTSTGAILAIGLGLGLKPREILDFYRQQASTIFPSGGSVRHWLKSKHDASTLRDTLKTVFKTGKLSTDSCCRLLIPTVRAQHGVAEVIVTAHSRDRQAFRDYSAVDAALASAAAPTYFDEAIVDTAISQQSYLDGGIWANNPVLPAIAEAVAYLEVPLERIDVLSIGTLESELDFSKALGSGKAGWAPDVSDLFFCAQQTAAAKLADALLTKARHLRVNQQTPDPIALDNNIAIPELTSRGETVAVDYFAAVRSRFLDGIHVADWRGIQQKK